MNYHEIVKQWYIKFGECCKSRDFESAIKLVSSDVCSFGTKVDIVTNLKDLQAHELGSIAAKEAMKQSKLNTNEVDELIMGQVLTSGTGQNPARQAAINLGMPVEKTAYLINQYFNQNNNMKVYKKIFVSSLILILVIHPSLH